MAFPDEDVVFGTQLINSGAFEIFSDLEDELPRLGTRFLGKRELGEQDSQSDLESPHLHMTTGRLLL